MYRIYDAVLSFKKWTFYFNSGSLARTLSCLSSMCTAVIQCEIMMTSGQNIEWAPRPRKKRRSVLTPFVLVTSSCWSRWRVLVGHFLTVRRHRCVPGFCGDKSSHRWTDRSRSSGLSVNRDKRRCKHHHLHEGELSIFRKRTPALGGLLKHLSAVPGVEHCRVVCVHSRLAGCYLRAAERLKLTATKRAMSP